MKVIGLTGGIGSGKSTMGAFFEELGATVIDADKVGHRLLVEDQGIKQSISDIYGRDVFDERGAVDRKKLAAIVFCDHEKLLTLDRLMHPRIIGAVNAEIARLRPQGVKVVIVEAPVLVEAGWTKEVDEVWVTYAPPEVIIKRLVNNMGYSREQAAARIRCQVQHSERLKYAKRTIDTNVSLDELRGKVETLWAEIK